MTKMMISRLLPVTILMAIATSFITEAVFVQTSIPELLTPLNLLRRKAAGPMGNVTMSDLEWDENLVEEGRKASKRCAERVHGAASRFYLEKGNANGQKLQQFFYTALTTSNNDDVPLTGAQRAALDEAKLGNYTKLNDQSLVNFEVLNPVQQFIGCVENHCSGEISKEILEKKPKGVKGDKYSYKFICVLGPGNSWPPEILEKFNNGNFAGMQQELDQILTDVQDEVLHVIDEDTKKLKQKQDEMKKKLTESLTEKKEEFREKVWKSSQGVSVITGLITVMMIFYSF